MLPLNQQRPLTILALASEFKGVPYLLEAKDQGCRVLLLVSAKAAEEAWPAAAIAERYIMPDLSRQPDILYAVSYLARTEKIDRIVALDDYDVATAAALREHLRLPGMGDTTARHFRDKLAMRVTAENKELLVPLFTGVFNNEEVAQFLDRAPAPWVLKPRFEAGAVGIRKMVDPAEVWTQLNELGDERSFYLLEQFVAGTVYHVDSLVWEKEVVFAVASQYGTPPLAVTQEGGIFSSQTVDSRSDAGQALAQANEALLHALGRGSGVAHSEFIQARDDGHIYFLETAARVGGANLDKLVKAATGIELWQEAARIELADLRREPYQVPPARQDAAGLITCLAQQKQPDLTGYDDPEVIWWLQKEYHAGLLVCAPEAARVDTLLAEYSARFARDFLASAPPPMDARTNI